MLITTTPKRQRLLRQILRRAEDPANHIHVTRASSAENPFFSKVRLAELEANYAGTRLYKQEIEGIFQDDVADALFTLDLITEARIDPAEVPDLARVVVAVDPAQTSSEGADESGIIVAGDDGHGHAYVLADYSLRGSPEQVMRRAVDAFRAHSADVIVFEDQSGRGLAGHGTAACGPERAPQENSRDAPCTYSQALNRICRMFFHTDASGCSYYWRPPTLMANPAATAGVRPSCVTRRLGLPDACGCGLPSHEHGRRIVGEDITELPTSV